MRLLPAETTVTFILSEQVCEELTVDDGELCSLELVAARELIEFHIPVKDLFYAYNISSRQVEF